MNLKILFDVIQSACVIIASVTAIYGISSWRRETKWKRKYELAEEVLSLFYECREKISIIRSPMGFVGEGKTRKRSENEDPTDSKIMDSAYVFMERYEREKEPFIKLATLKFRFIAAFGKEAHIPFEDLNKIIHEILAAANRLGNQYWKEQGRREFSESEFERHIDQMHKYENIVWSDYGSDEMQKKVDSCIEKIESYCLLIMEK